MIVSADNIFLMLAVVAATLLLILGGRAKGQQIRLLGGLGVAAAMVALTLLGEALMGTGAP